MKTSIEIVSHLKRCLEEGFGDDPADTPFLLGYEAALTRWKGAIESGMMDHKLLLEDQLIRFCKEDDGDFRAGFLEALVHVNHDLSRRH
jgi:hypothetical protein